MITKSKPPQLQAKDDATLVDYIKVDYIMLLIQDLASFPGTFTTTSPPQSRCALMNVLRAERYSTMTSSKYASRLTNCGAPTSCGLSQRPCDAMLPCYAPLKLLLRAAWSGESLREGCSVQSVPIS